MIAMQIARLSRLAIYCKTLWGGEEEHAKTSMSVTSMPNELLNQHQ